MRDKLDDFLLDVELFVDQLIAHRDDWWYLIIFNFLIPLIVSVGTTIFTVIVLKRLSIL
ncbi:hypothetical protein ABID14_000258 [Peptoniphilus olsenii]|uniref:Uncharacterized protein n=1 Tax=Peptoniphilus olsenii TaxID=411570 RepID=A0ABV2J7M0_9FIRM